MYFCQVLFIIVFFLLTSVICRRLEAKKSATDEGGGIEGLRMNEPSNRSREKTRMDGGAAASG